MPSAMPLTGVDYISKPYLITYFTRSKPALSERPGG
jgi:hypothetical protein